MIIRFLAFVALIGTSVLAQDSTISVPGSASVRFVDPEPRSGDWIRAYWLGKDWSTIDSVTCGRVMSINAAALSAERATCLRGRARSDSTVGRVDEPRVLHQFDLRDEYRSLALYRPSAARREAREQLKLGAYEGALVGCVGGVLAGVVVALVARPSVGQGAAWGCAGGLAAGAVFGGTASYRAAYNDGWVHVRRQLK